MNIKKSVKLALVNADKRQNWLAEEIGISPAALSAMLAANRSNTTVVEKIAAALNMKPSELVALGEE